MRLKDGTTTEDPRLGRLIQFDERSRNFPIKESVQGLTPRSYTWRLTEWYDQGQEGACVAYSLGHELNARPVEVKGLTDKFLKEDVYWEAQKTDPWEGGSYPGAIPFYEGTSVLAGVKVLHKKGYFSEYNWSFSLDELILGVGRSGPAVIGVNWYANMIIPDSKGFIYPTGNIVGGHAILVRGVDIKNKRFLLRNSWGKSWGIDGDCYISFQDMQTLLERNGEAVIVSKRKVKHGKDNSI